MNLYNGTKNELGRVSILLVYIIFISKIEASQYDVTPNMIIWEGCADKTKISLIRETFPVFFDWQSIV